MNKIILADNQAIFRAGIAKVLASEEDFRVAAQCADLERLLLSVDAYRSSIVLFASALRPEYQDLMSHVKAAGSRAVVIAENPFAITSGGTCEAADFSPIVRCSNGSGLLTMTVTCLPRRT